MKKLAYVVIGALFLTVTLTSCMKTRTCECRSALYPTMNYNYTVGPGSLSKATTECENYQFDNIVNYPDYTCKIQ
ncbi:MAG: hypothetical protein WCQ95_12425 [Bacteroidota bacterium]